MTSCPACGRINTVETGEFSPIKRKMYDPEIFQALDFQ